MISPDCDRCGDTGLDPDRYITGQDSDGRVQNLHEPCPDCAGLPHDPYMAAVARALRGCDIEPTEWWTDELDDRLDGVFRWKDGTPRAEHWPHGVFLGWGQDTGWLLIEDGGSRNMHTLPDCRTYGDPQQIAAVVQARLTHGPDGWTPGPICMTGDHWDPRPTMAAIEAWAQELA